MKVCNSLILWLCFMVTQNENAQSLQWAYDFGCSSKVVNGSGITHDLAGNCYSTGYFSGKVNFGSTSIIDTIQAKGYQDAYLIKYDGSGNPVWAWGIGHLADTVNSYAIALDKNANILITGWFTGTVDFDPGVGTHLLTANSNNGDVFIAKYNSNGVFIWAFNMGGNGNASAYNNNSNQGSGIACDTLGNIYATGYFEGTPDFNPGAGVNNLTANGLYDVWVAKYDVNGNYSWAFRIGGASSSNLYCVGNAIVPDNSGNFYITGGFEGSADFNPGTGTYNLAANGTEDAFLGRYDSAGNFLWAFNIGANASNTAEGFNIALDTNNNAFITGGFDGSADFNPGTGTNILSSTTAGHSDIFLAKYSPTGSYMWAFNIGSIIAVYGNTGYAVASDGANIFVAGSFGGRGDFDPGPGVHTLNSSANGDLFLAKYDNNGNYVWAFNVGTTGSDVGYALSADNSGTLWSAGYFSGASNDFDPNAGVYDLTAKGSEDAYIAKYSTAPTGVKQYDKQLEVTLFPNPSQGEINITNIPEESDVSIRDLYGREIILQQNTAQNLRLNIENKGVYFLFVTGKDGTFVSKFTVL